MPRLRLPDGVSVFFFFFPFFPRSAGGSSAHRGHWPERGTRRVFLPNDFEISSVCLLGCRTTARIHPHAIEPASRRTAPRYWAALGHGGAGDIGTCLRQWLEAWPFGRPGRLLADWLAAEAHEAPSVVVQRGRTCCAVALPARRLAPPSWPRLVGWPRPRVDRGPAALQGLADQRPHRRSLLEPACGPGRTPAWPWPWPVCQGSSCGALSAGHICRYPYPARREALARTED